MAAEYGEHPDFHMAQVGGQGGLERSALDLNKDSVEENAKHAAEEGGLEGGAAAKRRPAGAACRSAGGCFICPPFFNVMRQTGHTV
ncbi:hypothetical protein CYMTET_5994 [Cymbomonas tetramitiformis]|uniref:Uncharacterized protein n=1 Tax=Cymbomonas tetramitiformis TaxID=36881 RepID=A0AAE0GYC1_9CHLO|nr:hypothetical protein CYMTET_5994 [Cymbomonas tetramitiformis]